MCSNQSMCELHFDCRFELILTRASHHRPTWQKHLAGTAKLSRNSSREHRVVPEYFTLRVSTRRWALTPKCGMERDVFAKASKASWCSKGRAFPQLPMKGGNHTHRAYSVQRIRSVFIMWTALILQPARITVHLMACGVHIISHISAAPWGRLKEGELPRKTQSTWSKYTHCAMYTTAMPDTCERVCVFGGTKLEKGLF